MATRQKIDVSFRFMIFVLFLGIVLLKPVFYTEAAAAELDTKKVKSIKLGDYVWGSRISQVDLKGRVIVCIAYSGTDRGAAAVPNLISHQIRSRNSNLALFMVLINNEELPMALRLASAGKVKIPIVSMSLADFKKILPGLKLEKPKKSGRGRRGGKRGKQGSYATSALVKTPDGKIVYSGVVDRKTLKTVVDSVKKAARDFPVSVTEGKNFSKLPGVIRNIALTGGYGSVIRELEGKLKSKDSEVTYQAKLLIYNIKEYGKALLEKAAYFEEVHPQTAVYTYELIKKSFSGQDAAKTARDRLKKLVSDKKFKKDVAAFKLAAMIRYQCALLFSPRPDVQVDITDPVFQKANKSTITRLFRNIALFKKNYKDSKAAKECFKLLSEYGMAVE